MHWEKKRGLMAKILQVFFLSTLQLCISTSCSVQLLDPTTARRTTMHCKLETALPQATFPTLEARTLAIHVLIPAPLARMMNVLVCVAPPAAVGSLCVGIVAGILGAMDMIFVAVKNLFALSACFLLSFSVKALTTVSCHVVMCEGVIVFSVSLSFNVACSIMFHQLRYCLQLRLICILYLHM